jgi:polar amino acid transport system substrate-binding protein
MTSMNRLRRSHGSRRPGPFGGLRGWGGVTAMAAGCVLTASLTLLPLSRSVDQGPLRSAQRTATAVPAASDDCKEPERSVPASGADGPAIEKIKARKVKKLIVGVDQNSYRWGYLDPVTKEPQGFDIDLARAIAKDILGSEDDIIFRAIPTNQRVAALENGTVDLVVRTMTINCERIKQVAFSTAYFQTGQQVLAPKGSTITGFNDTLAGKRVCTAEGSTAYKAMEKESYGAEFQDKNDETAADKDQLTVPNQLDCLVRLQLGEVDAVVTDNALAAGQAAQDPTVELVGDPLAPEYYGVAAKLGNEDLVARVNKVLEGYRAGGANSLWMASYDEWLKTGLPGITAPPIAKYKTG